MVCVVSMQDKPKLKDPILIEGLPGIGFVANVATLHIIRELKAIQFAEINCSSFQDFAISAENGEIRYPTNQLYYYKGTGEERDLIILYGNTQALTTTGQYELCGCILDIAEELSCRFVVTLGGLKREKKVDDPKLYFAATDKETADQMFSVGAEVINGQIFGVAGLLIGIGGLRGFRGFCLLAETLGLYPDKIAAQKALNVVSHMFNLKISFQNLDETVEATQNSLENFGLLEHRTQARRKSQPKSRMVV